MSAYSSVGRLLRKVASTIGLAIFAMVLGLTFFLLVPTPLKYHVTERYSFAARQHDSPVRLAVIVPKTGPYQKVTGLKVSWDGICATNEHPEVEVLQLLGSVRARQTNVAVIQYEVTMWQGRARWISEVKESQRLPELGIECDNPTLAEIARQLAPGQSREDAYRLYKFAAGYLSWPRGSRTNVAASAVHAYETRIGGCHEFANLAVALMRARGIPARTISGLFLPYLLPCWSSTKTWGHPGYAHAWIEFYTQGHWEIADPSFASVFPGRISFGRTDGSHLSYGDSEEHDQLCKEIFSWAAEGGRVLGAISAPLKFAASAGADGVSILPRVQVRWGVFDLRWLGLLFFIVLCQIGAWRARRRARRNTISPQGEPNTRSGASAETAVNA